MSNGKGMIIYLIVGLIKKTYCDSIVWKMSQYVPKPNEPFGGDINVKVDLTNDGTKADIKNISHVDTSSSALKTNLASLKTEVDKLDIDKLAPVRVDLRKLSDAVKCRDVTNSWLDDKLPLAGLWLFLVEVILSKERIQNYSFFLISRKMKPRNM